LPLFKPFGADDSVQTADDSVQKTAFRTYGTLVKY